MCGVFTHVAVVFDLEQEFSGDVQVEDSGHADGAEISKEKCPAEVFDLVNAFLECEDHRKSAKQQNQDSERDEPVEWDDVVVGEQVPWTDSSEPHENAYIEQHVDSGLQRVILRLESEPIVPCENVPGDEARQYVVGSNHTDSADDEKL